MTYIDYNGILKPGQIQKNVVIPGYQEIVDMIKEYKDDTSLLRTLIDSILTKDVVRYTNCKSLESLESPTLENSIIVLRKKYSFLFSKQSIDCDDDIYTQYASHNFRIFIQYILQWNPFLNIPIQQKKIVVVHDMYGASDTYSSLPIFKSEEWWNRQQWWIDYKRTLPDSSPPPPQIESPYSAPPPPPSLVTIESLQAENARLQADIARLKTVIERYINFLIQKEIQLPSIDV